MGDWWWESKQKNNQRREFDWIILYTCALRENISCLNCMEGFFKNSMHIEIFLIHILFLLACWKAGVVVVSYYGISFSITHLMGNFLDWFLYTSFVLGFFSYCYSKVLQIFLPRNWSSSNVDSTTTAKRTTSECK